jgi:hypothetical protein
MPIKPERLPEITARTAPSIVIKASKPGGGNLETIGAIKSMDRSISRNITRRRELDSETPGITVELIPGAVTTFSLTLGRTVLNKSTMLEAFGILNVEDLIHQNIPITIEETRHFKSGSEQKTQVVTYTGCYFKENPFTVDIDDNWQIIQSAQIEVATCTVRGGGPNS